MQVDWPLVGMVAAMVVLGLWRISVRRDWEERADSVARNVASRSPYRELPRPTLDERLAMLAELRDRGEIGQREYEERRERILGQERGD